MERKLPAYPLFVKDPNFSLWAMCDELNGADIKTWYGEEKPVYGFLKTEEGTFCFLGNYDSVKAYGVSKAEQLSLEVTSFTTDYIFKAGKAEIKVSFVSPLLLTDVQMLSMPVCYINYSVTGAKSAEVSIFLNQKICYNAKSALPDKSVRGGVVNKDGYEAAFFGLKRQYYLSNNFDGTGADWGYFYLAGNKAFVCDAGGLAAYLSAGNKEFSHLGEEKYLAALCGKSGRIAIAYDDIVAIDYFGSFKKTAYLETHTIYDALDEVIFGGDKIDERLAEFDKDLKKKAQEFGSDYYSVLTAALRQSIAAHKLVYDDDKNLLFLSKECFSNGCIATVDISYPSMPLFLLYNTELVKGMMRPIFKFAKMPVWKFAFAPHDVGTYPACCGQVYGLKCDGGKNHADYMKRDGAYETHMPYYLLPENFEPYDFNMQMPVEECANMLIMLAACYCYDGDISLFNAHKDLCANWANYLVEYGLKPENQLCTDDFAGHLKNNLNLSIKATIGIGAYANLLLGAGDKKADKFYDVAQKFAKEIIDFSNKFAHSPITWDCGEESFSLKYNLAFDGILGLNLFPQEFKEREVSFYLEKLEKYSVPLDNRKSYTKSDWLCWVASLTEDNKKAQKIIAPIAEFLISSPARVPFCDWYDTVSGAQCGFQARSVQGGCFILLLKYNG